MHQYREYRYSRRFPGRAMPNPATSTFTPSFQLMEGIELGFTHVAGWSSPVAREAHNLEVTGSNPVPATCGGCAKTQLPANPGKSGVFYALACSRASQNGSRRVLTVPDSVSLFLRLISPSVRLP